MFLAVFASNRQVVYVGDTVEIAPSKPLVTQMQTPMYGGFLPETLRALGQKGIVTAICCECFISGEAPGCSIIVKTDVSEVMLNPKVVKLIHSGPRENTHVAVTRPSIKEKRAPPVPKKPTERPTVLKAKPSVIAPSTIFPFGEVVKLKPVTSNADVIIPNIQKTPSSPRESEATPLTGPSSPVTPGRNASNKWLFHNVTVQYCLSSTSLCWSEPA